MPGLIIDSENWRRHTACRGMNPDIFFADEDVDWAKRICGKCPDPCKDLCLLEGFMLGDVGVRGGLSTKEREQLHGVKFGGMEEHPGTVGRPRSMGRQLTASDIPPDVLVRSDRIRPEQLEWFFKLYDDGWSKRQISILFKFTNTAVNRVIRREWSA